MRWRLCIGGVDLCSGPVLSSYNIESLAILASESGGKEAHEMHSVSKKCRYDVSIGKKKGNLDVLSRLREKYGNTLRYAD